MVKFFKMTSLKVVCILFQALPALIVTEFFQCKFVQNEGFNNLLVKEVAVLQLCISDQCVNHLSKNDGIIEVFTGQDYIFKLNFIFKFT